MHILFLTMFRFAEVKGHSLYTDLVDEFLATGHQVTVATPLERRIGQPTSLTSHAGLSLLQVRTGNLFGVSLLEKGISTLLIERQFRRAIENHCAGTHFDLILYSTPPITFANLIRQLKTSHHAATYLMLKDIFPQNAIDIGLLRTRGWRSLLVLYFRHKEKKLYAISDAIGCMSPANARYVLEHHPELPPSKVGLCPNSLAPQPLPDNTNKSHLLVKYGIPAGKILLLYGGNLGRPQDVPYIIECIRQCQSIANVHFIIAGNGTERPLLERFVAEISQNNLTLLPNLPREDYEQLTASCDIGLIFLDHRFTIPNFPSRLLSYLQAAIPVLAATDTATDMGHVITDNHFGWWCESNSAKAFADTVCRAIHDDLKTLGMNGRTFFLDNYTADRSAKVILEAVSASCASSSTT